MPFRVPVLLINVSIEKYMVKRVLKILFLIFLIAGTIYIIGRKRQETLRHLAGPVFGTEFKIEYVSADTLGSAIRAELEQVNQSLSMFAPGSTVSRINDGRSRDTDEMLREVFLLSQRISQQTGGAFDVTVAPLVNAWGFGFKKKMDVSAKQVDSMMQFVGYSKVRLVDDKIVKEDPRLMLDFSSVAKGYAVDRVARLLDRRGVQNYMIEIGGEIVARGSHPEGRPWNIGIAQPTDRVGEGLVKILEVKNKAIATSGNYRRYYEKDGQRYAHTIDPHTGRPVQHDLLSATVIAPDCATADAYATAFMVMGSAKARKVLEAHPELQAFFIMAGKGGEYVTWASDGFYK